MDGIGELELLVKGLGETSTPQRGFGDSGAISGDNAAGAGGLPHGSTNFSGRGPEDGGEAAGSPAGSPPSHEGGAESASKNKLSEDDELAEEQMKDRPEASSQRGGSKKMMSKSDMDGARLTPARQLDYNAHERARVISQLRKSDRVSPGINVSPAPFEAEEGEVEKAETWKRGFSTYSDASDRAVEELQKSSDFYHGPPPALDDTGLLRKSVTCPNGHSTSAMFGSCQTCGAGRGTPTHAGGLMKSLAGLTSPAEQRVSIPDGVVIFDDEE